MKWCSAVPDDCKTGGRKTRVANNCSLWWLIQCANQKGRNPGCKGTLRSPPLSLSLSTSLYGSLINQRTITRVNILVLASGTSCALRKYPLHSVYLWISTREKSQTIHTFRRAWERRKSACHTGPRADQPRNAKDKHTKQLLFS